MEIELKNDSIQIAIQKGLAPFSDADFVIADFDKSRLNDLAVQSVVFYCPFPSPILLTNILRIRTAPTGFVSKPDDLSQWRAVCKSVAINRQNCISSNCMGIIHNHRDVARMIDSLSDDEFNLFHLLCCGYTPSQCVNVIHLCRRNIYYKRKRIGDMFKLEPHENINDFMNACYSPNYVSGNPLAEVLHRCAKVEKRS